MTDPSIEAEVARLRAERRPKPQELGRYADCDGIRQAWKDWAMPCACPEHTSGGMHVYRQHHSTGSDLFVAQAGPDGWRWVHAPEQHKDSTKDALPYLSFFNFP